jgi:hypothetical protein
MTRISHPVRPETGTDRRSLPNRMSRRERIALSPVWSIAALLAALFAVGCGNEAAQRSVDASTADASLRSGVVRPLQSQAIDPSVAMGAPTVDVDPVQCARRADGPPYSCLTCTVNGPCDTGVPCRLGRTTACVADRPVCADIGPVPNGTACGALSSGMVCTSGVCACPAGQQSCGGFCRMAGACTAGVGGCAVSGTWICSGMNAVCSAAPAPPQTETCNGVDDNCNGVIDDIASVACVPAPCRRGSTFCSAGAPSCSYTSNDPAGTACSVPMGGTCDGLGTCACPPGQVNCGGVCRRVGDACTAGLGICQRTGVTQCVAGAVACSAVPGAPRAEVCNGVDDNCNGVTDDIPAAACVPRECAVGVQYCSGGMGPLCALTGNAAYGTNCSSIGGGICNGMGTCTCAPGFSNCGGTCLRTGTSCTVGVGACQRTGTTVCSAGATTTCNVTAGAPRAEVCNGVDDNCDGTVDNIPAATCSPAECRQGNQYCSGGAGPYCSYTSNSPAGTVCSGGYTCNGAGSCCGTTCGWQYDCGWQYQCTPYYSCWTNWEIRWRYVCVGWWWWTWCFWEPYWQPVTYCGWNWSCGWNYSCNWNYRCTYGCR